MKNGMSERDLPVINLDDDPDNANWLRILAKRRQEGEEQSPQEPEDMADSLSSKPWDGDASNYDTPEEFCSACLVDENDGSGSKTKSKCHLPVREPGGAYNRVALGQAAARLAQTSIPPAARKAAARKLVALYARFDLSIPDSLKNMAL